MVCSIAYDFVKTVTTINLLDHSICSSYLKLHYLTFMSILFTYISYKCDLIFLQAARKTPGNHRRCKSMEFLDYDEISSSRPERPPPLPFKRTLKNETSLATKYNTISRLEKRSILQSLSGMMPFKSDRASPQPNEKPVIKRDLTPSPKPRHVTKIYV